jgi:hypothetical protein
MPQRIQQKRIKGWKHPDNSKCVARASRWGNPFKDKDHGGSLTHAECLRLFETYARDRMEAEPAWLEPLRGKDLACFCRDGEACHADILLRLANA